MHREHLRLLFIAIAMGVLLSLAVLAPFVSSPLWATTKIELAPTLAAREPAPSIATLEEHLLSGRYARMVEKWTDAPAELRIPWALARLTSGSSTALAAPLVRDLWMAVPGDGGGSGSRLAALRVLFYTYARVRIDGEFCRDSSSAGDLVQDLRSEFRSVLAYSRSIGDASLRALAYEALELEIATASRRMADPFICARGRLGRPDLLPEDLVRPLQRRVRDTLGRELLSVAGGA